MAGAANGRRHASRADVAAVASLVAIPLVVYGAAALLGHTVVPGDDLTQNYPLRVLVGDDIRAGHLPVFDPYIWSGAPLLAGWNAGGAYPLTWLFAALPGTAAWTLNLASATAVAGAGCYAFLRSSRLGVVASWLGGLTFSLGGAMVAQLPHIGLITGMSWVPVALLATRKLTERQAGGLPTRLGWTAALATAVALNVLAGTPRAIANAAAVLGPYAIWRIGRLAFHAARAQPASVASSAVTLLGGAAIGLGIGAVQLLPGLAAVASSQRAAVTASLFSAGSLPLRWLLLLGVPDLLGGSGSFGQPTFFASYNLTEVTCYVGVLPLVGAVTLAARVRRGQPWGEWTAWWAIAALGVLLAAGTHTPLWHLLIRIPLFNGQRLQSRSILVTDLALAVLFAHWADGWTGRPMGALRAASGAPLDADAAAPPPPGRSRAVAEPVLASLPPLCICALVVVALSDGRGLLEWMGVSASAAATSAGPLRPWLLPYLVLALGAIALVWACRRSAGRPGWPARFLTVFVVVDLAVFAMTTVVAVDASGSTSRSTVATAAARPYRSAAAIRPIATLHLDGRFALYDPTLLYATELRVLGAPDDNVMQGTYAVQGYSSLANGPYARATGAHALSGTGQDLFSPAALDDGVLDSLDTTAVLVPSAYLVTHLRAGKAPGASATGARTLSPGGATRWMLGTPTVVSAVTFGSVAGARGAGFDGSDGSDGTDGTDGTDGSDDSDDLRVGLVSADGHTAWSTLVAAASGGSDRGALVARWAVAVPAVELVVAERGPRAAALHLGAPTLEAPDGGRLVADGVLQGALVAPHWTYAGRDGSFAIFKDRSAAAPLEARPVDADGAGRASVRRLSGPRLMPTSAAVSSTAGADVVRAVAAIPGWHALWQPAGGHTAKLLPVRADGVVQSVRVPAGRGVLTWRYDAPELATGEALTLGALGALAAIVAAALLVRRRRARPRYVQ